MPGILRLSGIEVGASEVIALVNPTGKIQPSRIPDTPSDVRFTLVDGRTAYLPLFVADKIRQAGVQARVPFELARVGAHQIEVRTIDAHDYTSELERSLDTPRGRAVREVAAPLPTWDDLNPPQSRRAAISPELTAPAQPAPMQKENNTLQPNGTPSPATKCMMAAMCAAVDAVIETQAYATRKGLGLTFGEESIRAIGLSIYIDECRKGGAR